MKMIQTKSSYDEAWDKRFTRLGLEQRDEDESRLPPDGSSTSDKSSSSPDSPPPGCRRKSAPLAQIESEPESDSEKPGQEPSPIDQDQMPPPTVPPRRPARLLQVNQTIASRRLFPRWFIASNSRERASDQGESTSTQPPARLLRVCSDGDKAAAATTTTGQGNYASGSFPAMTSSTVWSTPSCSTGLDSADSRLMTHSLVLMPPGRRRMPFDSQTTANCTGAAVATLNRHASSRAHGDWQCAQAPLNNNSGSIRGLRMEQASDDAILLSVPIDYYLTSSSATTARRVRTTPATDACSFSATTARRRPTMPTSASGNAISHSLDSLAPLDKQPWFHPKMSRAEAETILMAAPSGSYLVRQSETSNGCFSLSVRCDALSHCLHMKISPVDPANSHKGFILGQFSKAYASVPEMIRHYTRNLLPIRGGNPIILKFPCCTTTLRRRRQTDKF